MIHSINLMFHSIHLIILSIYLIREVCKNKKVTKSGPAKMTRGTTLLFGFSIKIQNFCVHDIHLVIICLKIGGLYIYFLWHFSISNFKKVKFLFCRVNTQILCLSISKKLNPKHVSTLNESLSIENDKLALLSIFVAS